MTASECQIFSTTLTDAIFAQRKIENRRGRRAMLRRSSFLGRQMPRRQPSVLSPVAHSTGASLPTPAWFAGSLVCAEEDSEPPRPQSDAAPLVVYGSPQDPAAALHDALVAHSTGASLPTPAWLAGSLVCAVSVRGCGGNWIDACAWAGPAGGVAARRASPGTGGQI